MKIKEDEEWDVVNLNLHKGGMNGTLRKTRAIITIQEA
jgi:hypothetical protein